MSSLPPDALLPVLVADLADDDAREVLDAAAFTGGRVWVPLESAPVSPAQHVLEVHTPGFEEPLYYIAEPLGPPTDHGFPLRISPMPDAPEAKATHATRDFVVSRTATQLNLSASHTKDLSHVGPLPNEEDAGSQVGRAIAG